MLGAMVFKSVAPLRPRHEHWFHQGLLACSRRSANRLAGAPCERTQIANRQAIAEHQKP
jgi:hypothetical protein